MKKLGLWLVTAVFSALSCFSAFAGEWVTHSSEAFYLRDDSTYAKNGWHWIDGLCFYFTPEGYCLSDTDTPDGYQVNDFGAWVVDGVVQIQGGAEVNCLETLRVEIPQGFRLCGRLDTRVFYEREDRSVMMLVGEYDIGWNITDDYKEIPEYLEAFMDLIVFEWQGEKTAVSYRQLDSGLWRKYDFNNANGWDMDGTTKIYFRFADNRYQVVAFAGALSGLDTDAMFNASVKVMNQ